MILVAIDQLTKYLAVINLKQSSTGVFVLIPGVFELRYLENQSAAFGVDLLSIIQNIFHFTYWSENPLAFLRAKMIFFSVITIAVVILLCVWYRKIPVSKRFRLNIVTIFLGISVGATATGTTFLSPKTLAIMGMGVVAFGFGTAGGVLLAKFMNLFLKEKINPLIGSAGVSAVPMAARVSQKVGQEANPGNFLLMHAMGPNVAGVIGSAIAAGVLISLFG